MPFLLLAVDQASEGRFLWALAAAAFVPFGTLVAFRDELRLPWNVPLFALLSGVYLCATLSASGVIAYYELRAPAVSTERPNFHARVQASLYSSGDHLLLQMLLYNSGLPSFVSGYQVRATSTLGHLPWVTSTLIPEDDGAMDRVFLNDQKLLADMRRLKITSASDVARRSLDPVGEEILFGWVLFILPPGGHRVFMGENLQMTLRFFDRLNVETVVTNVPLPAVDPNSIECRDLAPMQRDWQLLPAPPPPATR